MVWSGSAQPTIGAGGTTCTAWMSARVEQQARDQAARVRVTVMTSWTQGFLAGAAVMLRPSAGDRAFIGMSDAKTIQTFLDGYCKDRPQTTLLSAAIALQATN